MADASNPTSSTASEQTLSPDDELRLDGQAVDVLGAQVDVNNITVEFTTDGLQYRAGIDGELLAITDEYEEVTGRFEGRFDSAYRFRVYDSEQKPWFHKADFWPYTDDSAENLHHFIRYAYTHTRDTEISISAPIDRDEIAYPFDDHAVLTYFDPEEERVRVFAADTPDARSAGDIANRVFQPKLRLYVNLNRDLISITVRAKAYHDPHEETQHETVTIDAGHITRVDRATISGTKNILWNPTDYTVTGDVWGTLLEQAEESYTGIRADEFNTYHALFLNDAIDTPDW